MQFVGNLAQTLIEQHPIDTAKVLERLSPLETWATLVLIEEPFRVGIVESFSSDYAARVLTLAGIESTLPLIREMPSEIATDIIECLPEELGRQLLDELPNTQSNTIEELLEYPEDTAGSVMSPDFVALSEMATVNDALTRLRRLSNVGKNVNYVYVIDSAQQLKGVLVMRDLVLASGNTLLSKVMLSDIIKVNVNDDIDDVANRLIEKKLLAVPVVNDFEELKGVIIATQLVKDFQEEGFEDAQKMFGAGSDEHASSGIGYTVRQRLPWLQVNLLTAFAAAAVIGAFDGIIAQYTILAAFLPVVAGQGGNAGAQALAVMLRAIALDEIDVRKPRRVLVKEALVGLFNGVAVGITAGIIAGIFGNNFALGIVVALAMIINLFIAGVAGASIPMVMERLGQDPAQSSNIILTTVTDIIGFAAFLGLAVLAMPWLGV